MAASETEAGAGPHGIGKEGGARADTGPERIQAERGGGSRRTAAPRTRAPAAPTGRGEVGCPPPPPQLAKRDGVSSGRLQKARAERVDSSLGEGAGGEGGSQTFPHAPDHRVGPGKGEVLLTPHLLHVELPELLLGYTSHVHPPAHQPPPRCWLSPPTPSWWGTSPGNQSGTRRTDTPAEGSRRLRAEDSPQKRASGSPSGPFRCGCPAHDALLRTTLPPSVPAVNDVGDHHPGLRDRRPVAGRGRPTRALPFPPLPRPSHALAHHTPGVEADAAGGPRRGGGWGPNGWPAGPTGLVPATTGRRLCGLLFTYHFSPAPLAPFIQTRFLGAAGGPLLPRAPNCIPRVLARQPGWREGERALG